MITPDIAALGPVVVQKIFRTLAIYGDFCHDNDPYGERDFWTFETNAQKVLFKIDYYTKA